jgi:serine/threonine protein phosphatase PrpC
LLLNNQVAPKALLLRGYRNFSTQAEVETISKSKVNFFNAGVFMQPHYEKVHKGGEDAASLSSNVLAVADGVGGWIS